MSKLTKCHLYLPVHIVVAVKCNILKMADNGTREVQQTEIPQHYAYIYKFRVEQCPLFLQHKCTQHRPFTCFHWHFQNQRRRKPVRRRDGTLNYSADEYCTKYDETTGIQSLNIHMTLTLEVQQ